MTRAVRNPLLVAAAGAVALLLVWIAAYRVPALREADGWLFSWVQVQSWDTVHGFGAPLVVPMLAPVYALLCAWVVWTAWRRRGTATAVAAVAVLAGANVVSQVLKELTATDRPWSTTAWGKTVDPVSWPSGHTTAATALAIAAVLASAPAVRRRNAALLGVWAFLVGAAVVWMSWHMPSDALAGWCVGAVAGGTALAGLRAWERRRVPAGSPLRAAQSSA